MKIYFNGNIIEAKDARVSVFDRGYLFGEGLFETFRSYQGKLPFIDKHFGRMEWGASFIGLPFPHPSEILKAVKDLLKANQLKDARIRVLLSGMNEGLRPTLLTENTPVNLMIAVEPFKPLSDEEYEEGVELAVVHEIKNDPPPAANIKSSSRITKMIALREIEEKSCFDGILLSAEGYVTETTRANIFWVEKDCVCTPPVSVGILPGVTREIVIALAKDNGMLFKEKCIKAESLSYVTEMFLTGSTLEVMPVASLDGNPIGNGTRGSITRQLQELYQERIKEELES